MGTRSRILGLVALLSLAIAPRPVAGVQAASGAVQPLRPTPMWTAAWDVAVREAPGDAARALTRLDIDQEVRITGSTTGTGGIRWLRVRLWGSLDGYARASALSDAPIVPASTPGGVPVAPQPVGAQSPMPLHSTGTADGPLRLRAGPDVSTPLLRIISAGTPLRVTAWATDGAGQAWYHLATPHPGWGIAEHVALGRGVGSGPDLTEVRGLGMWLTPPVLETAPTEAIISAARRMRITHMYVEVAQSHGGFAGAPILDRLLPAAHRAHIAVIAWVYPFLDDLPHDVAISVAAARYVTAGGERPDGLMADIEQNMGEPYVRAYGQVLRARLGAGVLMAASTYAPQTYWGRRYPFRAIAASWDLVAPMDYWHVTPRPYSAAEAYRFVAESIRGVRQASGDPRLRVEVLGQMFDVYQNGLHSPSGAEIRAAISAAYNGGAGIGFFEWNHATPEEWDALSAWQGGATVVGALHSSGVGDGARRDGRLR